MLTLAALAARTTTPLLDCMIWNGETERGYGRVRIDGVTRKVHRVAWELKHGPIPEGLVIDHLCRVRACINTDHMELVTSEENTRRGLPFRKAGQYRIPRPRAPHLVIGATCRNGHVVTSLDDVQILDSGVRRCRGCLRLQVDRRRAARQAARLRPELEPPHP